MIDSRQSPDEAPGLRAASGVGWNVAGFLVRSAAAFCINIALARLLGPEPFGLVALSMIVITFGNLLVDSGLSIQLIREPVLSPKFVRGVFTLQLLGGIILACGIVVSTPLITSLLRQPEAAPVIRALALMLVIMSAGQPSVALLRREMRFKTIQTIQILSYLIGYGSIGLPLAFTGAGVWALVWAQISQATFGTIASWALVRHSIAPWFSAESGKIARFGSLLAGSNVACWSFGAMPNFVISRTLGAGALGFYNRASSLTGLPAATLVPSVQTVALPLFSKLQADIATLRRTFLAVISILALAVFPISLLIAGSAKAAVQLLLGSAWMGAVPAFTPLACAICFDSIGSLCSTFLVSCGRPDLDFRTQAIGAVFAAISLGSATYAGASVAGLAWIVCALYLVRTLIAAGFVSRAAEISFGEIAAALRSGVLLGATVFAAGWAIDVSLASTPAWVRLAASWGGAITAAVASILLIPRIVLYADLLWGIRRSGAPIPAALAAWFERHLARA